MDWKQITNGVIGGILTSIGLYILGLLGRVPEVIVPSNAVLSFDQSTCPQGWQKFEESAGRMIIGSGSGQNLTTRSYRSVGGKEQHKLTVEEIPQHNHPAGSLKAASNEPHLHESSWGAQRDDNRPGTLFNFPDLNYGQHTHPIEGTSGQTGGEQPHDNMPPFITLTMCKKN